MIKFKKYLYALLFVGLLANPLFPQEKAGISNTATGLSLPEDKVVSLDEGFIDIKADCKGQVKWLVISSAKVKYSVFGNTIIVAVPPIRGQVISVFAIAQVDNKLTEFAKTNIQVGGLPDPAPTPTPTPAPTPNPNDSKTLHVTFLVDFEKVTQDLAKLVNSETLRNGVNKRGHWFRLYDIGSEVVTKKRLKEVADKVGGNKVLIVQRSDGVVVYAQPIPNSEDEVLKVIDNIK